MEGEDNKDIFGYRKANNKAFAMENDNETSPKEVGSNNDQPPESGKLFLMEENAESSPTDIGSVSSACVSATSSSTTNEHAATPQQSETAAAHIQLSPAHPSVHVTVNYTHYDARSHSVNVQGVKNSKIDMSKNVQNQTSGSPALGAIVETTLKSVSKSVLPVSQENEQIELVSPLPSAQQPVATSTPELPNDESESEISNVSNEPSDVHSRSLPPPLPKPRHTLLALQQLTTGGNDDDDKNYENITDSSPNIDDDPDIQKEVPSVIKRLKNNLWSMDTYHTNHVLDFQKLPTGGNDDYETFSGLYQRNARIQLQYQYHCPILKRKNVRDFVQSVKHTLNADYNSESEQGIEETYFAYDQVGHISEESTNVYFEQLFDSQFDMPPRHVMVYGSDGEGKSCLLKEFTKHCNLDSNRINCLENTSLAIYVDLKKIKQPDEIQLHNLLLDQMSADDVSEEEREEVVERMVKTNGKAILLVLNGLEQLCNTSTIDFPTTTMFSQSAAGAFVKDILKGKLFPNMNILSSMGKPFVANLERPLLPNRMLSLQGLDEKSIDAIILQFCGNEKGQRLLEKLKFDNLFLYMLCRSPFYLTFICLAEIQDQDNTINTLTELMVITVTNILLIHEEQEKKIFLRLSELAFVGLTKKTTLLNLNEGQFAFASNLIKKFRANNLLGGSDLIYFKHIRIQEIMAALYISFMSLDPFKEFISTHLKDPAWNVVVRFVAGCLLNPCVQDIRRKLIAISRDFQQNDDGYRATILQHIIDKNSVQYNIDQNLLLMLFESDGELKLHQKILCINNVSFNKYYAYCLGKVLSRVGYLKELAFHKCTFSDETLRILTIAGVGGQIENSIDTLKFSNVNLMAVTCLSGVIQAFGINKVIIKGIIERDPLIMMTDDFIASEKKPRISHIILEETLLYPEYFQLVKSKVVDEVWIRGIHNFNLYEDYSTQGVDLNIEKVTINTVDRSVFFTNGAIVPNKNDYEYIKCHIESLDISNEVLNAIESQVLSKILDNLIKCFGTLTMNVCLKSMDFTVSAAFFHNILIGNVSFLYDSEWKFGKQCYCIVESKELLKMLDDDYVGDDEVYEYEYENMVNYEVVDTKHQLTGNISEIVVNGKRSQIEITWANINRSSKMTLEIESIQINSMDTQSKFYHHIKKVLLKYRRSFTNCTIHNLDIIGDYMDWNRLIDLIKLPYIKQIHFFNEASYFKIAAQDFVKLQSEISNSKDKVVYCDKLVFDCSAEEVKLKNFKVCLQDIHRASINTSNWKGKMMVRVSNCQSKENVLKVKEWINKCTKIPIFSELEIRDCHPSFAPRITECILKKNKKLDNNLSVPNNVNINFFNSKMPLDDILNAVITNKKNIKLDSQLEICNRDMEVLPHVLDLIISEHAKSFLYNGMRGLYKNECTISKENLTVMYKKLQKFIENKSKYKLFVKKGSSLCIHLAHVSIFKMDYFASDWFEICSTETVPVKDTRNNLVRCHIELLSIHECENQSDIQTIAQHLCECKFVVRISKLECLKKNVKLNSTVLELILNGIVDEFIFSARRDTTYNDIQESEFFAKISFYEAQKAKNPLLSLPSNLNERQLSIEVKLVIDLQYKIIRIPFLHTRKQDRKVSTNDGAFTITVQSLSLQKCTRNNLLNMSKELLPFAKTMNIKCMEVSGQVDVIGSELALLVAQLEPQRLILCPCEKINLQEFATHLKQHKESFKLTSLTYQVKVPSTNQMPSSELQKGTWNNVDGETLMQLSNHLFVECTRF